MRRLLVALGIVALAAAGQAQDKEQGSARGREPIERSVLEALRSINLDEEALAVPKLDKPASTPGRLPAVDAAMAKPLSLIGLSRRLAKADPGPSSAAGLSIALGQFGYDTPLSPAKAYTAPPAAETWKLLAGDKEPAGEPPADWVADSPLTRGLRLLLAEAANAHASFKKAGGAPSAEEVDALRDHLSVSFGSKTDRRAERSMSLGGYHEIGTRTDIRAMAAILVRLLGAVESAAVDLKKAAPPDRALEWETPLGRVRVAGTADDTHAGEFLLLIDLGGNGRYEDVGRVGSGPTIVIDVAGNDKTVWETGPGPGAGILGIGVWADLAGDDAYRSRTNSQGAGVKPFAVGLLLDAEGADLYVAEETSQGFVREPEESRESQRPVAVLIDAKGKGKKNVFELTGLAAPGPKGRIQNKQGIAIASER